MNEHADMHNAQCWPATIDTDLRAGAIATLISIACAGSALPEQGNRLM